MIYLASPIKHEDEAVVVTRVAIATRYAASLYEQGKAVFCPAAHGHAFAILKPEAARSWSYWKSIDIPILSRCCTELMVLVLPGWDVSVGVQHEIMVAAALEIPTVHRWPDGLTTPAEEEILWRALDQAPKVSP